MMDSTCEVDNAKTYEMTNFTYIIINLNVYMTNGTYNTFTQQLMFFFNRFINENNSSKFRYCFNWINTSRPL